MESVCAVVCLGFPITGLSGVRVVSSPFHTALPEPAFIHCRFIHLSMEITGNKICTHLLLDQFRHLHSYMHSDNSIFLHCLNF